MAQDKKNPTSPQPAEDMFGRPTTPRHEETGARPREAKQPTGQTETTDAQYAQGPRKRPEEDEDGEPSSIDDLPDGDGLRSDLGTNRLPEVYWSAYPDKKPSED
jgi:hypothetical protein